MNDLTASNTAGRLCGPAELTDLVDELVTEAAPRMFALVEEYGAAESARVAGYGLAYAARAEVNSVEGDFHLNSTSVERLRTVFEISSRSAGVRRVHVVWLDRAGRGLWDVGSARK
ncbi:MULTISPECIES: hypothetical protein [Saccharothrix]|uniref:hypothetical protein n=1 Tax=Saccharothrix TaxID=2071 RepID=UPI00093B14F9|nr:hypothetical protein [Saccharothrix sp. CB00851]OKI27893.1 hypothetical protein A6A25_31505 [Saccharothrix sp. CB00851]